MKQTRSADELLAATMSKSERAEAMRTSARNEIRAALSAASQPSDPAPGTAGEATPQSEPKMPVPAETLPAPEPEPKRPARQRKPKVEPNLEPADEEMSLADQDLHKTSVSLTRYHVKKLLDLEFHYRRKGLPGLGTNKLVMAAIGAIEIGPELDRAVEAIVAQDRRTRRAREKGGDA